MVISIVYIETSTLTITMLRALSKPLQRTFKRGFSTTLLQAQKQQLSQINLKFFTKPQCQLCEEAKEVLSEALQHEKLQEMAAQKTLTLEYVDILLESNKAFYEKYRYDIPVLHVERPIEQVPVVQFMHRLNKEELIEELVEEI